jgi:hypothetical protein
MFEFEPLNGIVVKSLKLCSMFVLFLELKVGTEVKYWKFFAAMTGYSNTENLSKFEDSLE